MAELEQDDPCELLEFDHWEGEFSLIGDGYLGGTKDNKAIRSIRNQQSLLERCTSVDIDNLFLEFDDTLKEGFDFEMTDRRLRLLQKQMSTWSIDEPLPPTSGFSSPTTTTSNKRFKPGGGGGGGGGGQYLLKWQQSQLMEEDEMEAIAEMIGSQTESQADEDRYSKGKQDTSSIGLRIDELEEEVRDLQQGLKQFKQLMTSEPSTGGGNRSKLGDDMKSEHEIMKELKEQREANQRLRHYIDGILMKIIEKRPELLEIRM